MPPRKDSIDVSLEYLRITRSDILLTGGLSPEDEVDDQGSTLLIIVIMPMIMLMLVLEDNIFDQHLMIEESPFNCVCECVLM